MAYKYDKVQLNAHLERLISQEATPTSHTWLEQQKTRYEKAFAPGYFNLTFTAIPRFVSKMKPAFDPEDVKIISGIRKNFALNAWSLDRLCRAWWLLQLPETDENKYVEAIETLFDAAEVNEQIALYGALPLLAYPERFKLRAAEGIRTSIGDVFEAVALDNPYPSECLDEPAWNQLVLKAFFMEKPVRRIIGMEARANAELAKILSDYAHERWAAGRSVNPLLWWPVSKFVNEEIFPDIVRLFESEDPLQQAAAALACASGEFQRARELLSRHFGFSEKIRKGELKWDNIVDFENK